MGFIAQVLSFTRRNVNGVRSSDVKFDRGGGRNLTGKNFQPSGFDSVPLNQKDYLQTVKIPGSDRYVVVGYADPENDPVAQPGESRMYARNPETGDVVAQVHVQSDGSVLISNGNGSVILQENGEVLINGGKIDTSGDFITAAGISLDNHTHPGVLIGPASTGPSQ